MEVLLQRNFTEFYGLTFPSIVDWFFDTDEKYFEIEDSNTKELVLYTKPGNGTACISNPIGFQVKIINYDKFISSLPNFFQDGRKRSDLILTCAKTNTFVLGELKDSKNIKKHRKKAKKQLLETLLTLIAVPEIFGYIKSASVNKCCYFNKQARVSTSLNAVSAFNRLPNSFVNGFKINLPEFEANNFEFWEFFGSQTLIL
ncbi:hypothetical protein P3G55_19685 [Leptospira sp. 96542]|nr:hypothetical protein [Leptospira sp. 96542]